MLTPTAENKSRLIPGLVPAILKILAPHPGPKQTQNPSRIDSESVDTSVTNTQLNMNAHAPTRNLNFFMCFTS